MNWQRPKQPAEPDPKAIWAKRAERAARAVSPWLLGEMLHFFMWRRFRDPVFDKIDRIARWFLLVAPLAAAVVTFVIHTALWLWILPMRLVPDVQWCWAAVYVVMLALLSKQVIGDILQGK